MKRIITSLCIVLLFIGSTMPGVTIAAESSQVIAITLEDAVEKAIESDENIAILNYQLKVFEHQVKDAENQEDDLDDNGVDEDEEIDDDTLLAMCGVPDTPEYMQCFITQVTIQVQLQQMFGDQQKMSEKQRKESRKQIVRQIEQLNIETDKSEISLEELRAGVKLMVASEYVKVLMLEKQTDMLQHQFEMAKQDLTIKQLQFELGLISEDVLDKAVEARDDAMKAVEDSKENTSYELYKLAFTLDIPSTAKLKLDDIEIPTDKVTMKESQIDSFVENTFKVQKEVKNVELAKFNMKRVTRSEERKAEEYRVKIAEEQLAQLKQSLETKIQDTFKQAEDAFEATEVAVAAYEDTQEDYDTFELQYELGFISKQQLDQLKATVLQAEVNAAVKQYEYFLAYEQLKALQEGYIM
ncbi:hypothetical protein EJF36_18600 [Bacillus sp. HMF5848]|uniref:TolC family protein n=1 Tax=Bacillus sp. HMF5848 TaxID=2495421 RepID=UPI000F76C114|nr:TolC family protein [Bacillus sp. HMF5848]RSK28718.1 hypothetical protein EJF36_18600 [Bacillus sp. HMF5848]